MCCRECIAEDVEVPPESEMMINAKLIDPYCPDSESILEPCPSFVEKTGILTVKCYVCCSDGNLPLYVAKFSSEPCVIRKNTVAAVFEEACDEKNPIQC